MENIYRSNKSVAIDSEIINGMAGKFYRMARSAFESKNEAALEEIYSFIEKKILEAFDKKNISVFNQLLKVPIWIYEYSIVHNSSLYTRSFTHVSKFYKNLFNYRLILLKGSQGVSDRKDFNDFLYLGYVSYLYLFYRMLFYKKYEDLNTVLKDFRKLLIDRERIDYVTKYKIRDLFKEHKLDEANDLRDDVNIKYYANLLYYHSLFSIVSWLWFYYDENDINKDDILKLTNTIELTYDYGDELINDAIYIRENSHWEYLEINEWDNVERQEMEAYSPPQAHNWITFGLSILLLRRSDITNIDLSLIKNDITASMLLGQVEHNLLLIENQFEKWKEIIGIYEKDAFEEKKRSIINLFTQLKRRYTSLESEKHSTLRISEKKIVEFKEKSAKAWEQSSKLKRLFNQYKVLVENNNPDMKFTLVKHRILFQRAKKMFTDENYQGIIGSEDFAAQFGRNRFDAFIFNDIIAKKDIVEITQINVFLDTAIEKIKLTGAVPSLIIMAPEFLQINEFTENPLLKQRWQITDNVAPDLIGMYDEIPIYHTFSSIMKDKILICNFEGSFTLDVYNDPNSIPPDLHISVREFEEGEAKAELEKNPEKWKVDREGNELSNEEALNIIKTSVFINFEAKYILTIKDQNMYVLGKIDSKRLK